MLKYFSKKQWENRLDVRLEQLKDLENEFLRKHNLETEFDKAKFLIEIEDGAEKIPRELTTLIASGGHLAYEIENSRRIKNRKYHKKSLENYATAYENIWTKLAKSEKENYARIIQKIEELRAVFKYNNGSLDLRLKITSEEKEMTAQVKKPFFFAYLPTPAVLYAKVTPEGAIIDETDFDKSIDGTKGLHNEASQKNMPRGQASNLTEILAWEISDLFNLYMLERIGKELAGEEK